VTHTKRNWALLRIGLEGGDIVSVFVKPERAKILLDKWMDNEDQGAMWFSGTINDNVDEEPELYTIRLSLIRWMRVRLPQTPATQMEDRDA